MIYVVQARNTGLVKIGFTDGSLKARINSLQTGCPHDLVLLIAVQGDEADEAKLHRRFAACLERGEWFRLEPELVGWVADNWAFRVANDVGKVRLGQDFVAVSKAFRPAPPSLPRGMQSDRSRRVLRFLRASAPAAFTPREVFRQMENPPPDLRTIIRRLYHYGHVERVENRYRAVGHKEGEQ